MTEGWRCWCEVIPATTTAPWSDEPRRDRPSAPAPALGRPDDPLEAGAHVDRAVVGEGQRRQVAGGEGLLVGFVEFGVRRRVVLST